MTTKKTNQISMALDQIDENEMDLLIAALDLLENEPIGNPMEEFGGPMAGFLMAHSEEEAKAQLEAKMRDAKIEIKDRKRRIVLLKAKLIMASMNRLSEFFAPHSNGAAKSE